MASRSKTKQENKIKSNDLIIDSIYDSLEIKNFRTFKNIKFDGFKRINIFLGPNNSGKTSLLEAVFTHACGQLMSPFESQIIARREDNIFSGPLDYGESILSLFNSRKEYPFKFQINATLKNIPTLFNMETTFHPSAILSSLDYDLIEQRNLIPDTVKNIQNLNLHKLGEWTVNLNKKSEKFDVFFPPDNVVPKIKSFKLANFHDILSHRKPQVETKIFASIKRSGKLNEFVKEMNASFENIQDIDMIPYADGTSGNIYLKNSSGSNLPLSVYGDGVRRWYYLLGEMLLYRNCIHCIEEVDSTFHPKAYQELIKLMIKYSKAYNNQLFITSHSLEFTDNILETLHTDDEIEEANKDIVQFFTLKKLKDGTTEIWSMNTQEAYENRKDFQIEMRG